jgi:protein-S-isoprenylcysteine O-methyltransferase Ste14
VHDLAIATALGWGAVELRQGRAHRDEAVTADRGSIWAVRASFGAGALLAALGAHAVPSATLSRATWAWIGLVVMWLGIALRLWCFHTLGRYFTFTVQTSHDQPVIDRGPYSVVRHPSYLAILVIVTGVGLLIGNVVSLCALVVSVLCGVVYRIRVEDRALLAALGAPYRDYAATHQRLVPHVW